MSVDLIIRFPTQKHLTEFASWMSRQGEQSAFDDMEIQNEKDPIVAFQYHKHNPKFKTTDARRYSRFLEGDNLIIAHTDESHSELMKEP
jgi:hypothetical protein